MNNRDKVNPELDFSNVDHHTRQVTNPRQESL